MKKFMKHAPRYFLSAIVFSAVVASGQISNTNLPARDPYIPALRVIETNLFSRTPTVAYRFAEEQLARMSRTKLDTNRFLLYVERRWSIERLRAYCVSTNKFPEGRQNLVAENCPLDTDLYKGKSDGFDRIWVYVSEDDGHATYVGEAGTSWHRWTYSLNTKRGNDHWVIGEQLPNDFMDSAKFDPSK
jgi:hypothetical protein